MSKPNSEIQNYFSINNDDETFALCNNQDCKYIKIARGGNNPRSYTTTNLKNHLKNHHSSLYEDI